MEDKEIKILVMYVGVAGIRSEDIPNVVKQISQKIAPATFEGEIVVIPTQSYDTKLDCINPKYITDSELIKEHTELMETLNKDLLYQIEQIKDEKESNK